MKDATHTVDHKRLYLAVDGKMTHIPMGSPLTLTDKQAKKMGTRVKSVSEVEVTDLSDAGDAGDRMKSLKARAKELNMTGFARWGEARLIAEIEKVEKAIADGNNV